MNQFSCWLACSMHWNTGLHMCRQRGGCKIQQIENLAPVISILGTDINSGVGDRHINSRIRWDDNCRTINAGECNQEDLGAWLNLHLDQSRNCMNITSDWEELCHQNLSATQKMEWWERRRPLGRKCAAYSISLPEKIVVVKLQTSFGGGADPFLDQQAARQQRCFLSSHCNTCGSLQLVIQTKSHFFF